MAEAGLVKSRPAQVAALGLVRYNRGQQQQASEKGVRLQEILCISLSRGGTRCLKVPH